jgi:hypothetical protein
MAFDLVSRFDVSAIKILVADTCVMLPKGNLLRSLLEISVQAKDINTELDRGITWEPPLLPGAIRLAEEVARRSERTRMLGNRLVEFIQRCEDVEKQLAAHFGPLPE